jgi:hypothetical protein
MQPLVVICLLALGTNAGCSETSVDLSNYKQSCDFDDDCVSIVDGDICECGPHCGAINVSEMGLYEDDLQALDGCGFSVGAACGESDPFVLCRASSAVCISGLCTIE